MLIQSIYYLNSLPHETVRLPIVISILSAAVTILSVVITWLNVKKQIKSTQNNIIMQHSIKESEDFRVLVAKLLFELAKSDGGKLFAKQYASDEHLLLEKNLTILMNLNEPSEKSFVDCIKKFTSVGIIDKYQWIKEIEQIAHDVLKTKYNLL